MRAKVLDNMWVGDLAAAKDVEFLSSNNITAVINLTYAPEPVAGVDYFEYMLLGQELMPDEVPKTITKLKTITEDIKLLHEYNRRVLIVCYDGKNQSAIVAGYYLVTIMGMNPHKAIALLETMYFTPEQRAEEAALAARRAAPDGDGSGFALTDIEQRQLEQRNERRCLTLYTFKSLLRRASQ